MYERKMKKVIGINNEELTLDLANVTAVRISPVLGPDGEWNIDFRMYSDVESIAVPNRAYANAIVDELVKLCSEDGAKN